MSKKLPRKLSALLRLAVRDAKACEKAPGYELAMMTWHSVTPAGVCRVCMAGAVMANTLRVPRLSDVHRDDCEGNSKALNAIEDMRNGSFDDADRSISDNVVPVRSTAQLVAMTEAKILVNRGYDYELDRAPWPVYLKAATILAKAGL